MKNKGGSEICRGRTFRAETRVRRHSLILLSLTLLFATGSITAQYSAVDRLALVGAPRPTPTPQVKRLITVDDAVTIFLQQNLELVASRYEVDLTDAEKLSARVRPNPEIGIESSGLPLKFSPFVSSQTLNYSISQDIEMGGKRSKRIEAANLNSEVAEAQFQVAVWQLTNDLKRRFYAVLLARSLRDLSIENQRTFADIVERTRDLVRSGEIAGLDLQRLEIEKFKFDTDVATTEMDYEIALRELRAALGGDYPSMDIETAGSIDYYEPYDFSFADLRDKALAARPDLKAAEISERAANANIKLQDAQKVPDLTVSGGVDHALGGGSSYVFGVGVVLPVSDRNQTERAKAIIERHVAQNQQRLVTNQIISEVDKALIAFNIQKRRVELYRTGILNKVTNIQSLTELSLKAGESSTLELLDAIRTRRETLASFYQTIFDYESALLDLELATATPLQK